MKMDIKKMKGKDLYYYIVDFADNDFSEAVQMLMYAEPDKGKALKLLEDVVQEDKKLVALYPGNGDVVPQGAKLVGAIPDGALYVI